MLDQVQQRLTDIYCADHGHDIRDFVITDRRIADAIGSGAMLSNTDESVLVQEDDDGLALSVFLDSDMLERLDSVDPLTSLKPDHLDDLWKVVEGVSHFNYLVWCASHDRSVTLLELEMQAEVDKFVSTLLLMIEQGDAQMSSQLHRWLFEDADFRDDLCRETRARYEAASRYASRFCHRIRGRLLEGDATALPELRHFYRLTQPGKISHIHASAWASP
ncbi:MAG: hypothetical protein R3315_13325 [Woeseiaceae bacterium]|nr:hypothetical protein [Woeseiaceae bacterium]